MAVQLYWLSFSHLCNTGHCTYIAQSPCWASVIFLGSDDMSFSRNLPVFQKNLLSLSSKLEDSSLHATSVTTSGLSYILVWCYNQGCAAKMLTSDCNVQLSVIRFYYATFYSGKESFFLFFVCVCMFIHMLVSPLMCSGDGRIKIHREKQKDWLHCVGRGSCKNTYYQFCRIIMYCSSIIFWLEHKTK